MATFRDVERVCCSRAVAFLYFRISISLSMGSTGDRPPLYHIVLFVYSDQLRIQESKTTGNELQEQWHKYNFQSVPNTVILYGHTSYTHSPYQNLQYSTLPEGRLRLRERKGRPSSHSPDGDSGCGADDTGQDTIAFRRPGLIDLHTSSDISLVDQ